MYIPVVDELALGLSGVVGCPMDQAKVLVWLLLHIGCGYGYRQVNGYIPRMVYGMALGTIFCLSMFSFSRTRFTADETALLYFFLTVVYFITMQYRAKAAVYVFIGGFFFLSCLHLKRMWESRLHLRLRLRWL